MKKKDLAGAAMGLVMIVVAALGIMAISLGGLYWAGFLGKEREKIRYDIQKESQAHRDGLQRRLGDMQRDFIASDSVGKAAIRALVRSEFAQVNTAEFPQHLKDFLAQMGL